MFPNKVVKKREVDVVLLERQQGPICVIYSDDVGPCHLQEVGNCHFDLHLAGLQ